MSSLLRRIPRNRRRSDPDYKRPETQTIVHQDKSYHYLHATKGWRYVSALRVRAAARMQLMGA